MKYVVTWRERPAASFKDYEAAQERVLTVFKDWQMPTSLTIHQFVVRIGEYGGYRQCPKKASPRSRRARNCELRFFLRAARRVRQIPTGERVSARRFCAYS